jgi:hypothetical protein
VVKIDQGTQEKIGSKEDKDPGVKGKRGGGYERPRDLKDSEIEFSGGFI